MTYANRQVKLASRPVGALTPENFSVETTEVPALQAGQVLVKNSLLSLDPTIRTWVSDAPNYLPAIGLGEVVRALGVGQVVESQHPAFAVGDAVTGFTQVQQYALREGAAAVDPTSLDFLQKIDTHAVPPEVYLSTLGITGGLTAYFGLLRVGQPQPGDTVVVSGAAGSVGSIVGQIAKLKGCRVVGLAGDQAKVDYCVQELGYEACINYKTEDVRLALRAACPAGIDVYFDNVGGEVLKLVLEQLSLHARVVVCGAISQYNNPVPSWTLGDYFPLFLHRARLEGVLVTDHVAHFVEAAQEMASWLRTGQLKPAKVQIEQGIDNFLPALLQLFSGKNFGKLLLAV